MDDDNTIQIHGKLVESIEWLSKLALWPSRLIVGSPPKHPTPLVETERRIQILDIYLVSCCGFELAALWIANAKIPWLFPLPWLIVALIIFCIAKVMVNKVSVSRGRNRNTYSTLFIIIIVLSILGFTNINMRDAVTTLWLLALLLSIRAAEIAAYAIRGSVLFEVPQPKPKQFIQSSVQRRICLGIINWLEIIIIFACIYSIFPNKINWNGVSKTPSIVESLYLSTITQLTIGFGEFYPKARLTQGAACIQGILGLLIVVTNVSYYLNKLHSSKNNVKAIPVDRICDMLLENFPKERVICILAYGSTVFNQTNSDLTDVDVTIILLDSHPDDPEVLKQCTDLYPLLDLTFQYLSDIDFNFPDTYQFGNHGAFYAKMFASAEVLFGENIFQDFAKKVSEKAYAESLRRQIKEHIWRVQIKEARNGSDSKVFQQYARKYLIRIMQNLYFLSSSINYEAFKGLSWSKWLDLFSTVPVFSETSLFLSRQIYRDSNSISGPYSALLRSLYDDSRKLMGQRQ